jgi:hypothetical protein
VNEDPKLFSNTIVEIPDVFVEEFRKYLTDHPDAIFTVEINDC